MRRLPLGPTPRSKMSVESTEVLKGLGYLFQWPDRTCGHGWLVVKRGEREDGESVSNTDGLMCENGEADGLTPGKPALK